MKELDVEFINVEFINGWCILQNRVRRTLNQITNFANWTINNLESEEKTKANFHKNNKVFSYVDTFKEIIFPGIIGKPVCKLVDREYTNYLASKLSLGRLISDLNLNEHAPKTYLTVEDALKNVNVEATPVLYVKRAAGTVGKEVYCILSKDLATLELKEHWVIQEGVSDILLFDNRKLEFRFYVLLHNKKIYLCRKGFSYVHAGREYDPFSTDWNEQINKVDGTYITKTDDKQKIRVMSIEEMLHYDKHIDALGTMVKGLKQVFDSALQKTDDKTYQLLGCDSVSTPDFKMKLLEINTYPNLMHVEDLINEKVNSRVFASMMLLVLCDTNDGSWISIE